MPVPEGFAPIPLSCSVSKKSEAWLFSLPPTLDEAAFAKVTLQIPSVSTSGARCKFQCGNKHYLATEESEGEHPHITPIYSSKHDDTLEVRGEFTRWFRVVEDVRAESVELKPILLSPRRNKVNDASNMQARFLPIGFDASKDKGSKGEASVSATPAKKTKAKKRVGSEKKGTKSTKKKKKVKKTPKK